MPEFISLDRKTVILLQDVPDSPDGVVKTIIIYRWNEELRLFEIKDMLPLKYRHHQ